LRRRVLTDPALERRFMALPEAQQSASYRVKITLGMGRAMSALGQKQTSDWRPLMSALCHKQTFTPSYSITWSAIASRLGGTVRPSALAVFRLITSSNLVLAE
jgi:hypothetical protein